MIKPRQAALYVSHAYKSSMAAVACSSSHCQQIPFPNYKICSMKSIIGILAILLPILSEGQASNVKPLTIGDTVPDTAIPGIVNDEGLPSSINAYRGKLLVLDFMSTGCVPCVAILPKLDSLQAKYRNQLQIILVTPDEKARVQSFVKRHPQLQLPVVAADTVLGKLFPHEYISHVVWIDGTGTVKAITHSEYITERNIITAMQPQPLHWPVKKDITEFDYQQPLLQLNANNIPEPCLPATKWYTSVSGFMPGIQKHSVMEKDTVQHTLHVSLINRGIIELYLLLYQRFDFPMSQVLLQVKDKNRLVYNTFNGYYDDWQDANFYCVDAIVPSSLPPQQVRQKLLGDVNFYLGMQGTMQRRTVDCLVLKNKSENLPVKTSSREGIRLGMVTYLLNNRVGATPLIDETTGTTYTNLPIKEEQVADDAYLRKLLDAYGFTLVHEQRELEFLVISQP